MKRGASHIEIVLAFVLFVAFVGFALYFFSPTDTKRLVDTTLIYAFDEIEKNTSVEVDFYNVKINENTPPTPNEVRIDLGNINANKQPYAKDIDGNKISSDKDDRYVDIDRNGKDFIYIILSEVIAPDVGIIGIHDTNYYTIASSDTRDIISERRFRELNNVYYVDYLKLKKEEFNLPARVNFGAELKFSDGLISMDRPAPEGLDVFTESRRVEVLRENGKIEFGELRVSVW